MGQKVLIIGQSGTGKSTSMRNFAKDKVCLIKSINKQLPFRGKFDETYVTDKVPEIIAKMKATKKKIIVIDDAQYLMCNEFFRRATETGWQKYTDIGKNFYDILTATDSLADDVIVYFMLHIEKSEDGNIKIKTIGRMLDEKLTVEGTATIVLMTNVVDGVYSFQTQNSGKDICKSPMGMFKNYLIDNDLNMVDGIIREYYELSDEVVEEKGVSQDKPTRATRRTRGNDTPAPVEQPKPAPKEVAEEQAAESLAVHSEDDGVKMDTTDTVPPMEEPKRERVRTRTRTVETTESVPAPKVETTEATPVVERPRRERKTLAEKMAEGGYELPQRRTRTRGE